MANRYYDDEFLTPPLPSASVPAWAVALLLLSYIAGCRYFFGTPAHLLGGPPPKNEYLQTLRQPAPPPVIIRLAPPVAPPVVAQPAVTVPPAHIVPLAPHATALPAHAHHGLLAHPAGAAPTHHHLLHPAGTLPPVVAPPHHHIHHTAVTPPPA